MTQSNDDRVAKIRALLAKAERTDNEHERDAYNAKAMDLMIQWSVDESQLNTAEAKPDNIVTVIMDFDVPKSYSHEYTLIGIRAINALGAKGMFQPRGRGKTALYVIAFESDIPRIRMLVESLVIQCSSALASWWRINQYAYATGTQRFNGKRSFISGFADGVKVKLDAVYKQAVADAGHGAELVLFDRTKQVMAYFNAMRTGKVQGRRYYQDGWSDGNRAGQRANIGQTSVGGRAAIGR